MTTRSDEAAEALETYLSASSAALEAEQRMREAWKQHFEGHVDPPSNEWMAAVSAQREASDLALARAQMAAGMVGPDPSAVELVAGVGHPTEVRVRRRRRKESPLLRFIGRRGQRVLRATILVATLAATLVATAAGISLALEVAGMLNLIDNPIPLTFGSQLAIFVVGAAAAFVLRKILKPVEHALYGSKGIRPKPYSF